MIHFTRLYPDACILHINMNTMILYFKAEADFTCISKFSGIGYKISNNLHNTIPIFFNNQIIFFIIQNKGNSFLYTSFMNLINIAAYFPQIHGLFDIFQRARFYFRQVQNIID